MLMNTTFLEDSFLIKWQSRDDIYTTGSTMDAVAGELLAAGAVEVCCISICTGAEKSSLG